MPNHFHLIYKNDKITLAAIVIILLLRLLFIGHMGLMPQDAYYHFYGQHMALSYFDHPPMIAYLLRFFTSVFGEKVFVLKLADSIITFLSVLSFYYLSRCFLNLRRAKNAGILMFSTFMISILSLVSTPDVPLILFWTLSLITLYHAVFLEKKIYWIFAGIMMGLAFDSKYTALFLPAGITLFLILSNKHRKLLLSPWFWACAFVFIVTVSPVIIWNIENEFASFAFQSSSRLKSAGGFHIEPANFIGVLGHQSAILMPILFFALLYFLFKSLKKYILKRSIIPSAQLFLFCFFIPVFAGFICISFVYWVKVNWMLPAYITGIIFASKYLGEKWLRYQLIFSLFIHVTLAIELFFYPVPVRSDDTWFGWGQLSKQVTELKNRHTGDFIFSADDYKTSAVLNFYLDSMVYSRNVIGEPALQFDFIGTDLNALNGRNALFINSIPNFKSEGKENQLPPSLQYFFDDITELAPILIKNGNRTARKFLVFYCRNYHSKNLPGKKL